MRLNGFRALSVIMLWAGLASSSHAQVIVGEGELLTQDDLIAGEFLGQQFQLGPGTVFHVLDGGVLGGLPEMGFETFDMGGSKVVLESGGMFDILRGEETTFATNMKLDVLPGAQVVGDGVCEMNGGSEITLLGGEINSGLRIYGSVLRIESGSTLGLRIDNNSSLFFNGGEVSAINFWGVNSFGTINGGVVRNSVRLRGNSLVFLNYGSVGSESKLEDDAQLH